jgi:alkyldihydroxyacetonephosphate synthase
MKRVKKDPSSRMRHWGWGTLDRRYDPEKRERFIGLLADEYGLKPFPKLLAPVGLDAFKLPLSRLKKDFVARWKVKGLSTDRDDRILHACGKSYRDLVRMRSGDLERVPDGVFYIRDESDLIPFFRDAAECGAACVPFGGGTGVVGGTECVGSGDGAVVVIDVKGLASLVDFDDVSRTVTFQAGILGPELERVLNERGVTLGHFPQSFEFSTLGGWVATRSAGQNSTKYGKIERMVQSLTIHAPAGVIRTHAVPASATGPSLKDMLVGSEGIYGIITEVTLRVSKLPEAERFVPVYFKSFSDGIGCVRNLVQSGVRPSVIRLMDPSETALLSKLSLNSALEKLAAPLWFKFKRLGDAPCFCLMAFEGRLSEVAAGATEAERFARQGGGALLGKSFREKWKKERFELPYLRDDLLDRGYFIDTLETAAPWSKLERIHSGMRRAFEGERFGEKLVLGAHLSHAYPDGASLYFTFIGSQRRGHEIRQWEKIKTAATEVILDGGGALSHHHGIGYDHRRWMGREHSELALGVFKDVKNGLDPAGILNPGKLI